MNNKITKKLLAFDVGHTTGIVLVKATIFPIFYVEYLRSTILIHKSEEWLEIVSNHSNEWQDDVDEVWAEYPRLNSFSTHRAKTMAVVTDWRMLLARSSLEINEVLPSTWKAYTRKLDLQSYVYLSSAGIRVSKHELDAFGICYWRAKVLHKELLQSRR